MTERFYYYYYPERVFAKIQASVQMYKTWNIFVVEKGLAHIRF